MSVSRTKPELLDSNKISILVISEIFKYLTDTDLSRVAVNKQLADQTLNDSRWTEKLRRELFKGFYLKYLISQIGDGQSIELDSSDQAEEKEENPREKMISEQVNNFLISMKAQGVRNFQSIYARYIKSRYFEGSHTLNEDKFILLSHHEGLIKKWLSENRIKIIGNESLGLEGRSAIFYLAVSGFCDGLKLYHQAGFDFTVSDINGDVIQGYVGLSGNVDSIDYCATTVKLDMTVKITKTKIGVQHFAAKSGSKAALYYSKDNLKLSMKALTEDKTGIQHHIAASGNPHLLWDCRDKFKLPMALLSKKKSNIYHFAARCGDSEGIKIAHEMKLDMSLKCFDFGFGVQHEAARSHNVEALKTCVALGLDMNAYTYNGVSVQHCAALSGIQMLRFCRDMKLDMKAETKDEDKKGIQHILAMKGTPEDFSICNELGLDIYQLDAREKGIEHYAAENGNSEVLRFFKKSGRQFRSKMETLGMFGVQHAAAKSGDPLTILHCVEYGLEMKGVTGVNLSAEALAAKSKKPAALLIMQLLGLQIDRHASALSNESENPTMKILAQLMSHHHASRHPYPIEIQTEWNKLAFENRIEHAANFFLVMSNKENVSFFSKPLFEWGFSLSENHRQILRNLSCQLQNMKDANLARVYIYLNYFHLNLVTSKKIQYKDEVDTFTAIMRYAIDGILNKIFELRDRAALEKQNDKAMGLRSTLG